MDDHKQRRDEQFWFTLAVLGFNYALLAREVDGKFAIISSILISLLGSYLVFSRWIAGSGRQPSNPPDAATASAWERLQYTAREMSAVRRSALYVIAEFSGSFFQLVIMGISSAGVMLKNWEVFK